MNIHLKRWMVCLTLSVLALLFSYWMAYSDSDKSNTLLQLFHVFAMITSGVVGVGFGVSAFTDLWEKLDE